MEVKPGYKQTEVGVIPEDWDDDQSGKLLSTFSHSGSHGRIAVECRIEHSTVPCRIANDRTCGIWTA